MANLQATKVTSSLDVQQNGFVKLGNAYVSSGTGFTLAHFSNGPYYNGSAWANSGLYLQLNSNDFNVVRFTSPSTFGTGLSLAATGTNSTTANLLGLGAAAGTAAADGKFLVNAGGTAKPFLEVTNCLGNGSTSTATFSVFKGYLGVKIGNNVGPATAVTAGTYYLRLWSNA